MGSSTPTPAGFVSVKEAAERLGMSRWDVMRLIREGKVQSLVLVHTTSLDEIIEEKS